MSFGGLAKVAEGVASLADANDDAQLAAGLAAIDLISVNSALYEAWNAQIAKDANAALADFGNVAKVAFDQAKKQDDTTKSEEENGMMEALLETKKQNLELLSSNLLQVFAIIDPVKQMLSFFTGVIGQPLKVR
jgi:hypothetical protein